MVSGLLTRAPRLLESPLTRSQCAYHYGVSSRDPDTGLPYNMKLGGRPFLLQLMWSLKQRKCAISDE